MPPGKPPEQEDAGNAPSHGRKRDRLRERTPPYAYGARPKAMKEKVAMLVGNIGDLKWCLFEGLQNSAKVQTTHCLRRELEFGKDRAMFLRLQNAIGSIMKNSNGVLYRQLRLDSPDNQDQMTSSMHSLFDGTRGIGSGSFCLLPLLLRSSLNRVKGNPHMSARQMFPAYTNLFYVHVFKGEDPITISHCGPQIRPYEDLPDGLETLEADLETIASCGRLPDLVKTTAHGTISIYILDPADPSKRLFIVRSHMNVANVLADAMTKLLYRKEKLGIKFEGAEKTLWNQMYPVCGHWVKEGVEAPVTTSRSTPDPDRDVVRSSERLNAQTELAPQPKAKATAQKRNVQDSAPTVLGTKRKRSYSKISAASKAKPSQQRAPPPRSKATAPSTTPRSSTRRTATATTTKPRPQSTIATRSSTRRASTTRTEEPKADSSEPPQKRRKVGSKDYRQ